MTVNDLLRKPETTTQQQQQQKQSLEGCSYAECSLKNIKIDYCEWAEMWAPAGLRMIFFSEIFLGDNLLLWHFICLLLAVLEFNKRGFL